MNKEERILKYINSADELVFNGKRYYENDFYNDVENLVKENQKYKEVIDTIKNILKNQMNYREFVDIVNAIEDVVKEVK